MKIAFIEPGLHVCGGIRRILETSNKLVEFGHDVTIFHPKGTVPTWIPTKAKVSKLSKIQNQIFDVAVFNLAEQYKEMLAAKALKKVFWVLAPEALYKTPEIPIKALRQNFTLVANSTFTANYIRKYCTNAKNIPVIHGAINPNHFKYDPSIKKCYNVLYYGSTRPWKGTSIIELGLKMTPFSNLKMEGLNTPQDKLWMLYNRADIFVSAAQVEGFSFPELEAMACGCAVVTTNSGGNQDFVKHSYNALVVPRNSRDIAYGIKELMKNTVLRKRFIENGLKTAREERFTWEYSARQFEKVLQW